MLAPEAIGTLQWPANARWPGACRGATWGTGELIHDFVVVLWLVDVDFMVLSRIVCDFLVIPWDITNNIWIPVTFQ